MELHIPWRWRETPMWEKAPYSTATGLRQHTGQLARQDRGAGRGLFFAGGAAVPAGGSAGDLFSGGGFAGGGSGRGVFAERAGGCRHCGSGRLLPAAGLILALQLGQQTWRLVLCVNLMDEAARRGVTPQIRRLGQLLDVAGGGHRRPQRKGLGGAAASGGGGVPPGAMGGRLEADLRPAGGGGAGTAGDGNVPPPCRGAAVGKPAHRGGTVPVAAGAATAGSALRAGPAGQPDGVGGGAGGGDRAAVRPVRRARPPRPGPAARIGC